MRCRVAASHSARARSNRGLNATDVARTHTVRKSGLECSDAGHFPAANNQVGCPTDVRCQVLATAHGHVVDEARNKPLINVEVRRPVIEIRIVVVHEALVAGAARAYSGSRRLIVLAVCPGVHGG